jgi:hypothetical protein
MRYSKYIGFRKVELLPPLSSHRNIPSPTSVEKAEEKEGRDRRGNNESEEGI